MSVEPVWEWWENGEQRAGDDFVAVDVHGMGANGEPPVVAVVLGTDCADAVGYITIDPDDAEEFARALLKAAATVRDMQAPKPLSE